MMGTCMRCERLLPIVGKGRANPHVRIRAGIAEIVRYTDRQLAWFPIPHDDEAGEMCEGENWEIR